MIHLLSDESVESRRRSASLTVITVSLSHRCDAAIAGQHAQTQSADSTLRRVWPQSGASEETLY
jgi:hypothetical protein